MQEKLEKYISSTFSRAFEPQKFYSIGMTHSTLARVRNQIRKFIQRKDLSVEP